MNRRAICNKCGHAWEEPPKEKPMLEVVVKSASGMTMLETACPSCKASGPWILDEPEAD